MSLSGSARAIRSAMIGSGSALAAASKASGSVAGSLRCQPPMAIIQRSPSIGTASPFAFSCGAVGRVNAACQPGSSPSRRG
jgi:hypothetical protein